MDYWETLTNCMRRAQRLDKVIENLESLLGGKQPTSDFEASGARLCLMPNVTWFQSACGTTGPPAATRRT